MYEEFYGLKADPFRLSADYRFCFSHPSYARAKAYVQYALYRAEGFVLITGRPGTGKTTLVNDLVASLPNKEVVAGTLVSTQLEANDLLLMTGHAFGLDFPSTQKALVLQRLIEFMNQQHRQGMRTLLIIDEAQDLAPSALEELRLLTNLQRNGEPLLQIALLGQDSLREIVRMKSMEQVHQRLIAAWRLEPLDPEETMGYVRHRLERAGWNGDPALEPGVLPIVYEFSQGIPRRINLICSRLLLHGFIGERHTLTADDAENVARDLHNEELALPDYEPEDAVDRPDPKGKESRASAAGSEERARIWAEIDRGLFAAAEPRNAGPAKGAERAAAAQGRPAAMHVEPEASGRAHAGAVRMATAQEAGVDRREPHFSATGAAAVHVVPEKEEHWRNVREEQGTGLLWSAPPRLPSRLLPLIVGLFLAWLVVVATLVWRGGVEVGPVAAIQQWWGEAPVEEVATGEAVGEDGQRRRDGQADEAAQESAAVAVPPAPRTETARPGVETQTPAVRAPESAAPQRQDRGPAQTPGSPAATASLSGPAAAGETLLVEQVLFRVNSTTVDPPFDPVLDGIATTLIDNPGATAEIIGYTDRFGSLEYNMTLSRQRAQAVANRLIQRGIAADRLRAEGQGPRESDDDISRAEERVVEVTVATTR